MLYNLECVLDWLGLIDARHLLTKECRSAVAFSVTAQRVTDGTSEKETVPDLWLAVGAN